MCVRVCSRAGLTGQLGALAEDADHPRGPAGVVEDDWPARVAVAAVLAGRAAGADDVIEVDVAAAVGERVLLLAEEAGGDGQLRAHKGRGALPDLVVGHAASWNGAVYAVDEGKA
jgi:hypothetical protein